MFAAADMAAAFLRCDFHYAFDDVAISHYALFRLPHDYSLMMLFRHFAAEPPPPRRAIFAMPA